MGYLPICVDVEGQRCLVVGGDESAERRVEALRGAGANVTVISPSLTGNLNKMARRKEILHLRRSYRVGDLADFLMVFAVTEDSDLQFRLFSEAQRLGVLINVADAPGRCSFLSPAVVRRGELQIAISTSGASPALAKRLKQELEAKYGPEYRLLLELLRAARAWLKAHETSRKRRAQKLNALVQSDLRSHLRHGDYAGAQRVVARLLGDGASFDQMGFADRLKC